MTYKYALMILFSVFFTNILFDYFLLKFSSILIITVIILIGLHKITDNTRRRFLNETILDYNG